MSLILLLHHALFLDHFEMTNKPQTQLTAHELLIEQFNNVCFCAFLCVSVHF